MHDRTLGLLATVLAFILIISAIGGCFNRADAVARYFMEDGRV